MSPASLDRGICPGFWVLASLYRRIYFRVLLQIFRKSSSTTSPFIHRFANHQHKMEPDNAVVFQRQLSPPKQDSPFFKLPYELRELIYEHVFITTLATAPGIIAPWKLGNSLTRSPHIGCTNVLLLNKQIYHESMPIFHTEHIAITLTEPAPAPLAVKAPDHDLDLPNIYLSPYPPNGIFTFGFSDRQHSRKLIAIYSESQISRMGSQVFIHLDLDDYDLEHIDSFPGGAMLLLRQSMQRLSEVLWQASRLDEIMVLNVNDFMANDCTTPPETVCDSSTGALPYIIEPLITMIANRNLSFSVIARGLQIHRWLRM